MDRCGSHDSHVIERTFVMTDIVASTPLVCSLGDARFADLITAHDEILGSALRRAGGTEVRSTGDGMLAEFNSPTEAVHWALEVQHDVRDIVGMEIRVGAHLGIVVTGKRGYVGRTLHLVARLAEAAAPSSLVLTAATAEEADFSDGVATTLSLRGFDDPVAVVVVGDRNDLRSDRAEDRRADVPA